MTKYGKTSHNSPWVPRFEQCWQPLMAEGICKTYNYGETIFEQGEKKYGLFYLHQGRIKVSLLSANGAEKILSIHEAPTTFGEVVVFDTHPFFATAIALNECKVYFVPKANLEKIVETHPQMVFKLFQANARKLRILALQLEDLTFLDSPCRIAHMLLKLASDYGVDTPEGISIMLPITHQELADVTSVSRTTVTVILNDFSRAGLIAKKRKMLIIRDPMRLEMLLEQDRKEQ